MTSPPSPLSLQGQHIALRQMTREDAAGLLAAAADGELWKLKFTVVPDAASIAQYVDTALQGLAEATVIPLVTVARSSGQIIGSTRFWRIDGPNRSLEIGQTWLARSWQRSAANTEAKFLMLRHAFETMHCVRVQLTTDMLNEASRAAILRLGAVEEGIIRNERIMPDGRVRTSVRFSIIDSEWPTVKAALQARLARA